MNVIETVLGNVIAGAASGVIVMIAGFVASSKLIKRLSRKHLRVDSQDKLYGELIAQILSNPIRPKEVVFIQHSGYIVCNDICKLLSNGINVVLYQQTSSSTILCSSGILRDRIDKLPNAFLVKEDGKKFSGHLVIKRFASPASLRAVVVDDNVLIASWYLYGFNNGRLAIRGSENIGILVQRESPNFRLMYEMILHVRVALDGEPRSVAKRLSDNVYLEDVVNVVS